MDKKAHKPNGYPQYYESNIFLSSILVEREIIIYCAFTTSLVFVQFRLVREPPIIHNKLCHLHQLFKVHLNTKIKPPNGMSKQWRGRNRLVSVFFSCALKEQTMFRNTRVQSADEQVNTIKKPQNKGKKHIHTQTPASAHIAKNSNSFLCCF